jgi:hypothetical protein
LAPTLENIVEIICIVELFPRMVYQEVNVELHVEVSKEKLKEALFSFWKE